MQSYEREFINYLLDTADGVERTLNLLDLCLVDFLPREEDLKRSQEWTHAWIAGIV